MSPPTVTVPVELHVNVPPVNVNPFVMVTDPVLTLNVPAAMLQLPEVRLPVVMVAAAVVGMLQAPAT
jgi:hypothetical protein